MTECPCEREPPLPAPPAPSTAPPATNPSPSPVPLGAPIPPDCIPTEPSEEEEVEMLDWDESDDDGGMEDDPTAIDADDDATPPDLCDAPANPAAGSRSTSPKPRHGGSATVGLASTCWVWMETPDALPRAMEYWYFAARAGQAMELLGLPSSVPSTPPTGKFGGKVILIHLEGYEDWSPQSPRSSSSETSSEHGSSAPTFVPHEWAAGVLDGRPTQARPLPPRNGGCRAPAAPQKRRDNDPDNDREGPHRRHDAPRSSRVRQLFPGCASDRSVRVQSRSPHPYRRAAGTPELEDLERGRTPCRSLQRSLRARDIIPHAADDWERRRSRSPGCRGQCVAASCNDYMGSLDPLADLCLRASPAWSPPRGSDDPMILEASYLDSVPTAPDDAHVAPQSPAYIPVSALWWGNKQTNCTPTVQDEIVFGPGVQQQEPGGSQAGSMDEVGVISGLVTKMDIDTATERGPTAAAMTSSPAGVPPPPPENQQPPNLYTGSFCELPAPVLQAPAPGEPAPRARKMKKPTVSTRSSSHLAARPSAVPVAQRAQRKLMQELSFIDNNQQQAPDAAVTEYLDLYADDLPEQAVKAIQTAARLGNKRLVKILEAVVQEADALEMET
ncbi:hypothetical protein SORBI_3008G184300 [Sorghum bicolor]|uniref:Uncharacterized protein n=1 Tax=Sorghum bicolor TaxID=4558 RepID=A0A1B6PEG2_SORBI|nr:hypothetical protein SORBI_3008G184300 [Sorghum bicolor]